jgi:hypothetical protein
MCASEQVLVTPVGRLKVCGLGVSEALGGEVVPTGAEELLQLQRDDVVVSATVTQTTIRAHLLNRAMKPASLNTAP